MKRIAIFFRLGLTVLLLSAGFVANAAIYTAVASGSYNNAGTWAGGNVPPSTLAADVVIIPSGVTVTLDPNQVVTVAASTITVDGTLNGNNNSAVVLTAGTLNGNGNITVDSMAAALALTLGFTGDIETQNFNSQGLNLTSGADLTVNGRLWLDDGILNIGSGILNVGNNATIVVAGGNLSTSGSGLINVLNGYNVLYIDGAATTGWELTHGGLNNVEINVPASAAVTLGNDLNLNGELALTSGILDLNGHDLMLNANAAIGTGSGMIESDNNSDISININGSSNGLLNFTSTGNAVNNLHINLANSSDVFNLGSDLDVHGALTLQSGRLNTNGNDLTVLGTITANAGNSYVVTGQNGWLTQNVGAGANGTFQIGTTGDYTPVTITSNGSGGGMVSVGVSPTVYANGTAGTTLSTDQPLVNATWRIKNQAGANGDIDAELFWPTNLEVNGFNRLDAYVSQNTNGSWDNGTGEPAHTGGNGLHGMMEEDITTPEVMLAVFGEGAVTTSVKDHLAAEHVILYPMPASHTLFIKAKATAAEATISIINSAGQVVKTAPVTGIETAIPVADLSEGLYQVQYSSGNNKTVYKFIKM